MLHESVSSELAAAREKIAELTRQLAQFEGLNESVVTLRENEKTQTASPLAKICATLTLEIGRLRGALKPFAERADDFAANTEDFYIFDCYMTVGDFRRASAAYHLNLAEGEVFPSCEPDKKPDISKSESPAEEAAMGGDEFTPNCHELEEKSSENSALNVELGDAESRNYHRKNEEIVESSGNVFADLGLENPEGLAHITGIAIREIKRLQSSLSRAEAEKDRLRAAIYPAPSVEAWNSYTLDQRREFLIAQQIKEIAELLAERDALRAVAVRLHEWFADPDEENNEFECHDWQAIAIDAALMDRKTYDLTDLGKSALQMPHVKHPEGQSDV